MKLNVKPLSYEDYDDVLIKWWKDWDWTPPQRDFLPQDGESGLMVWDKKTPICAGFIYTTNSKVAWVDWIISNKEYKNKDKRKKSLLLLIEALTKVAKNSKHKYAYALIKNQSLIKTYEDMGYIKGDTYSSEMIKVL
tara:strand:+ start:5629 stop:6039 length:411 start_codon:yes stop_codon:yes gene_type:complete